MLVSQVLLYQHVSVLQCVDENDGEGKACADEQDGDVHEVEVMRDVVLVALVSQLGDRDDTEQAEGE